MSAGTGEALGQEGQIPSFDAFRKHIADAFGNSLPGARLSEDGNNVVIITADDTSATVSLDILYRFYVDTSMQRPAATHEDLVAGCQLLVNNWRESYRSRPIFEITERPKSLDGVVLMQKCVA